MKEVIIIHVVFSLYYIGVYLLFAKFPNDYPYKPPEMRFVTPVSGMKYYYYIIHNIDISL